MKRKLHVSLLGTFSVRLNGEPIEHFESVKVRALLAYLVVEKESVHSRDALAALFWSDVPDAKARQSLRQALSNLRKVLGDADATNPILLIDRQQVQLNPAHEVTSDFHEFMRRVRMAERHAHRRAEGCFVCAAQLQEAVDLYQGEFLVGFVISNSYLFDDWVALQRERVHRYMGESLNFLIRFYEQRGDLQAALQCANTLVQLDPWREETYVTLMRLHAARGERSTALWTYRQCAQILQDELGIEPLPETRALEEAIRAGQYVPVEPPSPPCQLPTALTPLVGREEEIAVVGERLLSPDCHLLTLTGMGGVGKSRLALEVAERARHSFPDGVYWVSLTELEEADSLPHAIAAALQLPLRGPQEPAQELAERLRHKALLLVLDDFEHLMEARTLVAEWLRAAPGVCFLVTSRSPLGLHSEEVILLEGLPYPSTEDEDRVETFESARLFLERARRANPLLEMGEEHRSALAEICRLAGGLPLTIELAAAWVRHLTPHQIVEKMREGLEEFVAPWPDFSERHRSLRGVFEWSWRLLSEKEQKVLARLSVFRGRFALQAAAEIAAAEPSDLFALVEASLLQRQGEAGFRLHPLVRRFAWEKLNGEQKRLSLRHARYYARLLSQLCAHLFSSEQVETLARIESEWPDMLAAWNWGVQNGDELLLKEMLQPLFEYLQVQSRYTLGVELFSRAEEAFRDRADSVMWQQLRVYRAALAVYKDDLETGETLLREGLAFFRAHQEPALEALALYSLAHVAYKYGNFSDMLTLLDDALKRYQQLEDARGVSDSLNVQGLALFMLGEYPRAVERIHESMQLYRAFDDPWGKAKRLNNLALAYQAQGEYERARECYAQAIDCWEALNSLFGMLLGHINLGLLLEAQGELQQALQNYQQARGIAGQLNIPYGLASALNNMGNIYARQGDYRLAQQCYSRCLELRRELGDQRGLLSVLNNLGQVARLQGELQEAVKYWLQVLQTEQVLRFAPVALDTLGNSAELLAEQGDWMPAVMLWAHIAANDAAWRDARETARQRLERSASYVSETELDAWKTRGRELTLEEAHRLGRDALQNIAARLGGQR